MKKIQIIAIIAAAITFICVLSIMLPKGSNPKATENKQDKVVVAVQKIEPMTIITKDMLKTKSVNAKDIKSDAYSDISKVVGKIAAEEIASDDQLTESNTDDAEDSKYGLAVNIPKGMRAVTLSFENDAQGALDNLLKVGNTVDIISILKKQDGSTEAKMLMQKKQIVAINNTIFNQDRKSTSSGSSSSPSENDDSGNGRNITLIVTPQESVDLLLYQNCGTLKLVLRSQTDDETVTVQAKSLETSKS